MNDIERARAKREAAKKPSHAMARLEWKGTTVTMFIGGEVAFEGERRDFFEMLVRARDAGLISHPAMAAMMASCP